MENSKQVYDKNKRQEYDNKRYENVFKLIIILKIMYIVLALISTFSTIKSTSFQVKDNIYMISAIACIIAIMMNYYLSWSSNYSKDRVYEKSKTRDYIESFVLMIIFVLVISATGLQTSDYKILSILAVIIGAIQFGQKYSVGVSICYSSIIMAIDLLFNKPSAEASVIYLEKDIVLTAVLFIISIVLGMYVDTERQYFKELKKVANMDELTGIHNHRYFQDALTRLIEECNDNTEVSLLFMDIDYFKHYNDTHGHQAGDLLLREVGDILKACIRNGDIVSRYGGEEFAVILPNTGQQHAIRVGERIRKKIEESYFKGQESQPNKNLTMSIGVSTYPKVANSKYDLISTADHALYKAKAFNRNRVEHYHSILDELYENNQVNKEVLDNLKKLMRMINQKDKYTYGHVERVVKYCKYFGGYLRLSPKEQIDLQIGAYLHDIGKFDISKEVLNKRNNLNSEEFEAFKSHSMNGEIIIKEIECLKPFIPMVKYHHERYDGKGYPEGLKAEEIPYLARVLAIVDSFDSMISTETYISEKVKDSAIASLLADSGKAFDPQLVELFVEMLNKNGKIV
ncbi:diguanylate cyclase [Romboutsia ilealis]|uniref:Diguanylate cyclase n=1 Tax=Romboutsia faecis TaxID=2764597 RepID=A0ABR7JRQ0_9FIRM|nr:diguanylate cyclase [Romboutsia faecis]MBC5997593.1 diguanylate cyclase [Romboutsia faecis]MRN24774.1 diguanylate cyclase [Romboutsia ilealis]